MSLCKYRHIFWKEGEGPHSIRLFNIAIVDLAVTIVAAFFISKAINKNFYLTLLVLLIIGVFIHRLFCVNTTINKLIFGEIKVSD